MIFIENNNLDPALNHAIELYVMDKYDEDIFMLWQNKPCILIGRYQNINMEVNLSFTEKNGLDVVRRLSGGGAIYCDTENMQYTFITKQTSISNSFAKFAEPVVKALKSLGLEAEFTGRNDILLNGLKVSGNAQFHKYGKILHHGTLLFKANTYNLSNALKVRDIKFKGKGVRSVASRIGFISNFVSMNAKEFKHYIGDFIKKEYEISETTLLSDEDLKEIAKIRDEIFARHEWNYGNGSLKNNRKVEKYSFGLVEISIDVEKNKIKELTIEGDFFSELGVIPLCESLKGVDCSLESISKAIEKLGNLDKYIKGMKKDILVNDIMKLIEAR
ncbi:MAG: lipoate--protein ligase [Treponema sp.]